MKRLRSSRPFLLMLVAAALFARAFMPAGTMPERLDDGTFVAAICTADGVQMMPLEIGGERPSNDGVQADSPCAFAGFGTPALPPPGSHGLAVAPPGSATFLRGVPQSLASAALRLRPPATGPPVTV